jgi:hypothetical protein
VAKGSLRHDRRRCPQTNPCADSIRGSPSLIAQPPMIAKACIPKSVGEAQPELLRSFISALVNSGADSMPGTLESDLHGLWIPGFFINQ